jgi:hypothetical protein
VTHDATMTSVLCWSMLPAYFASRLARAIGRTQLTQPRRRCNVNTRMMAGLIPLMMIYTIGAPLKAQRARAAAWSQRDSAVAHSVAGCYELLRDGWESDSQMAKIEPAIPPGIPRDPVRFELTAKPARGWDVLSQREHNTYFQVRVDSIAGWEREGGLFTTWVRVSDTEPAIVISRPLPMAGLALRVKLTGSDLVGTIVAFTHAVPDDGKSSASHAVTARRIACDQRRL